MSPRKNKNCKAVIFIFILSILLFIGYYLVYPDVASLKNENPKKTSFMQYREDEWKRDGKKIRPYQIWIPLKNMSPYIIKAVLIAEDDKFWHHDGFDFEAIEKAIEKNIKSGRFKVGGSTISQQLSKNIYLTPSKNPIRKIKEAILTWRIERSLTKKRILELYLNVAEWGEGIFGIEAASRSYYGKSASALSPEEAVRLASVLPNPRKYSPLSNSRYVENRSRIIYDVMVRRGIVVPEYKEMLEEQSSPSAEEIKNE